MRKNLLCASLLLGTTGGNPALLAGAARANVPQPVFTPAPAVSNHLSGVAGWHGSNVVSGIVSHGLVGHTAATSHTAASVPLTASLHFAAPLSQLHGFQSTGVGSVRTHAASAAASSTQVLNLNSSVPQFAAGSLAGFHTITIDVGGKQQEVNFGSKLTGAELVAAEQVLDGGRQTLVLSAAGKAIGGSFDLSNTTIAAFDAAAGGSLRTLDISRGVSAVDTLSNFNLVGSLVNFGTLEVGAPSSVSGQITDTISAAHIFNAAGGVITSAAGVAGVKATLIQLSASSDIVNKGMIVGSRDLNLSSPLIANSGLITSRQGSVNFGAGNGTVGGALAFDGSQGTVQAKKGDIVFSGSGDISISGGNFLSKQLNFDTPGGNVNASLGQVTGAINGNVYTSHIAADTASLHLGNITNAGDPTYYNSGGDVVIDSGVVATNGNDLAIVASGNIIANGGKIDTTAANGGNSGNVTLIAGAAFVPTPVPPSGSGDTTTTLKITDGGTGGYIDLSGTTLTGNTKNAPLTAFTTASTNGNSGDVLMVAYQGSKGGGSVVATSLSTKGATSIDTTHGAQASGGDVTIIAGGGSLQVQNIKTTGATVSLEGAIPSIGAGKTLTITDGTITGGAVSTEGPSSANLVLGTISAGNIIATSANNISTTKTGALLASDSITINAGSTGSAKAPLLTDAAKTLTLNGLSAAPMFVTEGSGTALVGGSSTVPGQSVTVNETKSNLAVDYLNFTNVALTNTTLGGNITLNPNQVAGNVIGEIYATGSTPSTPVGALGNGVITITAAGNIIQGGTTAAPNSAASVQGKTVILSSTAGSIGDGTASGQPLFINAANLTANAGKGSVTISDGVQTTLNAGNASITGGTYSVTGSGLAVAGVINAAVIELTAGSGTVSGGPGTVLAINANIGSSKTTSVTLSATAGILQQNSKAFVQAAQIALVDTDSGDIGSASMPVQTKSTGGLQINATSPTNTNNIYVNQTGNVTLSNSGSVAGADTLRLTVAGILTLGATPFAGSGFDSVILTSPNIVVNSSQDIDFNNLTLQSTAALAVNNSSTSTAQIVVAGNLMLSGVNGAAATSITLGNAKTGLLNPFGSNISPTSLTVNTKGVYTSSIDNSLAAGGDLIITASNVVDSDVSNKGPVTFQQGQAQGAAAGNLIVNLTGSQAAVFGNAAGNIQLTQEGIGGSIQVTTKGAMTIDGTGIAGHNGQISSADLYLNSAKITFGAVNGTAINAKNLTVVSNSVAVNNSSTITATGSATFTAKGALAISGDTTVSNNSITAGSALTLGSTTVLSSGTSTDYVTTAITLGAAKGGAGNPLLAAFGSGGNGPLSNLTIATTGLFSSASNGFSLNTANPVAVSITAANLINTSTTSATTPYLLSANGVGVSPGSVTVNLTGAQAITMGNFAGNLQVSAVTDQSSGGSVIAVTTKGDLTSTFHSVMTGADANVSLTSAAGNFLITNAGGTSALVVGADSTLNLSGAKSLVVNESFTDPNVVALNLTSGSTQPFVIGQNSTPAGVHIPTVNGVVGSIGTFTNSNLTEVSINTGAGIFLTSSVGFISMNPASSLFLYSTGLQSITGSSASVIPGAILSISGAKGISFGTPNPQDSNDPLSLLGLQSNKVAELFIQTPGTFTTNLSTIYLGFNSVTSLSPNLSTSGIHANALEGLFGYLFYGIGGLGSDNNSADNAARQVIVNGIGPPPADIPVPHALQAQLQASSQGDSLPFTPTSNGINITLTKQTSIAVGGDLITNTPTIIPAMQGANGGDIIITTNGTMSVVPPSGAINKTPLTTAIGNIILTSGGNMTVAAGAIVPSGPTALTLVSSKSLAVNDPDLLTNSNLTGVKLGSGDSKSFIVGATGAFTNGTAGNIAAPIVILATNSLTNNGTIDGVGVDSSLTISSLAKGALTIVSTGTGSYGTTTAFANVNVLSSSNINLGNLFTSSDLLGNGSVTNVFISTANNLAAPAGTVTFSPNGSGILVGADANSGNGGSIVIDAKSFVYSPASAGTPLGFDASTTVGKNASGGTIDVTTTAALTVGNSKGNIFVTVGGSTSSGVTNLESTAGTLTVATELDTGYGSLKGNNVVLSDIVDAGNALQVVTNGKAGSGTITESNGAVIKSPQLTIGLGSAKLAATPLQIKTASLFLESGALNLANDGSGGVDLAVQADAPLAALTLVNSNAQSTTTSIGSISTTAGAINITVDGKSTTLSITAGSQISAVGGSVTLTAAGSAGNPSTLMVGDNVGITAKNGSISLLNSSDSGGGVIQIGNNVNIYASGTAAGVGQVTIANFDTTVPSNVDFIAGITPGTASTAPAMIQTVGGNVYFAEIGNTGGTITVNGGGNILSALGRNIVLDEAVGTLTLQGGDTITADPPIVASTAVVTPVRSTVAITNLPSPPQALQPFTTSRQSGASTFSGEQGNGLEAAVSNTRTIYSPMLSENQTSSAIQSAETRATKNMQDGVRLFSPDVDTVIETHFGRVFVAAQSLVLLMAFDGGIAVYNLHDSKHGSVVIASGKHTLALAPGRHALLTNRPVGTFEEINPIQSVAYRRMVGQEHEGGLKIFQADFELVSLLQSAEPLRKFMTSNDPSQRRTAQSMLKTAAILGAINVPQPFMQLTLPKN